MKKNAMSALAMALAVLLVFPARASPATPSNASRVRAPATASDWQYDDGDMVDRSSLEYYITVASFFQ